MLRSEIADGVAILTLAHPQRRNALSRELLAALDGALAQIAGDDAVRAPGERSPARGAGPAGWVTGGAPPGRRHGETRALAKKMVNAGAATLARGKRAF